MAVMPAVLPPAEGDAAEYEVALKSLSQWQLAARRFRRHKLALIGVAVFGFMLAVAILAPIVAPFKTLDFPGAIKLSNPGPGLEVLFLAEHRGCWRLHGEGLETGKDDTAVWIECAECRAGVILTLR